MGQETADARSRRSAPGEAPEGSALGPEQLRQVLAVTRMLAVTTDLGALLRGIAEAATSLLRCERASIFLHDPKKNELWTTVAIGLAAKEIRVPVGVGIAGNSFKSNEMLHVSRPYEDPRFNPEPDKRSGFVTRNLLTLPMAGFDTAPLGVVQAINKIGGDFTQDDKGLIQLLADQAGVAIQRYNLQQKAQEGAALAREMDLARKVQEALIPKHPPQIPGIQADGWSRPASTAGGDCFDLWKLADGRLGILLADASGHGIAPALVVSQVRTLLRTLCEMEPDPHKLMSRINERLIQDLEPGWFVTAFAAFLSSDGLLNWCSCGQGPTYIRRSASSPLETLDPLLPPLGVMHDLPHDLEHAARLERGGMLILASDGFFEAYNAAGEQYGTPRLSKMLGGLPTCSPGEAIRAVRESVRQWQGGDEPLDDQTIVVVARN